MAKISKLPAKKTATKNTHRYLFLSIGKVLNLKIALLRYLPKLFSLPKAKHLKLLQLLDLTTTKARVLQLLATY